VWTVLIVEEQERQTKLMSYGILATVNLDTRIADIVGMTVAVNISATNVLVSVSYVIIHTGTVIVEFQMIFEQEMRMKIELIERIMENNGE
jgi:FtsH-binding integral membrane protein